MQCGMEPALEQTTRPATRPEKMMMDCRMFRKFSEVISLRACRRSY